MSSLNFVWNILLCKLYYFEVNSLLNLYKLSNKIFWKYFETIQYAIFPPQSRSLSENYLHSFTCKISQISKRRYITIFRLKLAHISQLNNSNLYFQKHCINTTDKKNPFFYVLFLLKPYFFITQTKNKLTRQNTSALFAEDDHNE